MGARGEVLLDSFGCDTLPTRGKRSISLHNTHPKGAMIKMTECLLCNSYNYIMILFILIICNFTHFR